MKIRVVGAWLSISVGMLAVAGCKNNAGNAGVPAISTQPMAATVTIGQTATFSVTASGTGTLIYQWFENGGIVSVECVVLHDPAVEHTTTTNSSSFMSAIPSAALKVASSF